MMISQDESIASEVKCKNSSYECTRPVEKNQVYCLQHILKAPPTTGYRRCSFVTQNGNHCTNARLADPG